MVCAELVKKLCYDRNWIMCVCMTDDESKCVRFSVLHEMLQEHYHPQHISSVEAREIIDESFQIKANIFD